MKNGRLTSGVKMKDAQEDAAIGADALEPEAFEPTQTPRSLGEIGLQNFPPYLMNRIVGRYNSSLQKALADAGLTPVKMRVLAVLSVLDGVSVHDLSVYTVTEPSTLSRALDAMEETGIIRKGVSATDSRARELFLTDEGAALFKEMWPHMQSLYGEMFKGVSADELDGFIVTLRKILRNIRVNQI